MNLGTLATVVVGVLAFLGAFLWLVGCIDALLTGNGAKAIEAAFYAVLMGVAAVLMFAFVLA